MDEFEGAAHDMIPAGPAGRFRRHAFSMRAENGMPRAIMLSILVHAGIGAVLILQAVPTEFIRASGAPNMLEVLLISAPAGGQSGSSGTSAAPAAPAASQQPVTAQAAPEILRPKMAAREKTRRPAQPQPTESAPALPYEIGGASGSTADTGRAGNGAASGNDAAGGPAGGGSGGGPFETSFGQADAPRFLEYVQPRYPLAARQQGIQGTVLLRLTIDERGRLVQAEVLESPSDGFAESAVEAVKRSVFAPAMRDGRPVACRAVLPMRFTLRR